jgi:hypothetical protein
LHERVAGSGHTGNVSLATGGRLQFDGGVGGGQTVSFRNNAGDGGTLVLQSPGNFAARIAGFKDSGGQSDRIEIVGKTGLTESYSGNQNSGILTLKEGATTIATLHFLGKHAPADFHLATSGGNTFITDVAAPHAPAISGTEFLSF